MKPIFKYLAITLFLFTAQNQALAQSSQQDYKFDGSGNLCELKLTLPDSTEIKYKHLCDAQGNWSKPFVEGDYAKIIYMDGTVVDFTESYFNGEYYPDKYPALYTVVDNPEHSDFRYLTVNQWYKMLRKTNSAPKGKDMLVNMFYLQDYSITFPDNSMLLVSCDPDPSRTAIHGCIDVCENGDSWNIERGTINSINWHASNIEFIDYSHGSGQYIDLSLIHI